MGYYPAPPPLPSVVHLFVWPTTPHDHRQTQRTRPPQSRAAKLEASLEAQRPAALAALPAEFGFPDLKSFIKAVKAAAGVAPKAKRGRKPGVKVAKPAKGKRTRGRITPEIKAAIKAASEAGKTGLPIAKELGISPASVQNVKKELGLTKPRGAATVVAAPDPVVLG